MEKSVHIFENVKDLSGFMANDWIERINVIPDGRYFSIALSGGSTPRQVFRDIANDFGDQINWEKVLLFWGDERCVPPESDDSNYKMARESLLDKIQIPSNNIIRIMGENEPFGEAKRYETVARKRIPSGNLVPSLDFILLGLGDDGHTASIFPDHLNLLETTSLFEVAEHPQSKQKRITATGRLISQAKTVAFLVTGEGKSKMVARVIEKKRGWRKLPAAHILPVEGELLWLLDAPASSKLKEQKVIQ